MPRPLVIVESPAKARTLTRFLGRNYRVEASFGHVRDLPESAAEVPPEIRETIGALAVDTENDFKPYYVIPSGKKRHVSALRSALKDASEVLLATDPDREGESISWHLLQVLKPRVPARRIAFHEITEGAVREALAAAHDIDQNLVRAQESRRILDRLFGYTLSPVLWKKVRTGLSAGRVQSVAVRLLVEREEARRAFRSAAYWDAEATLDAEGRRFTATLVRVGNKRVATGKDFDPATGRLAGNGVRHLDEAAAKELVEAVRQNVPWRVTAIEEKPYVERPAPPFTTSTLTQEASRKLGFSTARTMRIAQRLKDGVELADGQIEGLITYHRTDSTTLSEKALTEAARVITSMFGPDYYRGPRRYQTKVRNAQEAHEAIRPTDFRLAPQKLSTVLDADELRLYELVWKRTMASQMPDARLRKTTVEISAEGPGGEQCVFTLAGKAIDFPGYRRAYVEGSDDPEMELEDQETVLPRIAEGQQVGRPQTPAEGAGPGPGPGLAILAVEPKSHETVPPARYTEASLIKKLEEEGIGRPSTYEPTIETILRRGYVFRQGKSLVPSFTAFAVTKLLREHFGDYVDIGFTARMEDSLDAISNGERDRTDFIREFYRGDGGRPGLEVEAARGGQEADYPVIEVGTDPESGLSIRVRIGRFGPFLQLGDGGAGNTVSLPEDIAPADLDVERAMAMIRTKAAGPRLLGTDPATGVPVYALSGRFGAYVQLGETPPKGSKAGKPRRASLPRGLSEGEVTLEHALRLLDLPRTLGPHPETGEPVMASEGRFGPYVKHGDDFRSLEPEDDVHTIGLERALALLAAPKQPRRRQQAAKKVLKELGAHPVSGAPVRVLEGRYGPYVTDGKLNATVPKTTDPANVSLAEAVSLLDARAARGTTGRGGAARRAGAKKGKKGGAAA